MYKPRKACDLHALFSTHSNGSKYLIMSWVKALQDSKLKKGEHITAKTRAVALHPDEDELSAKLKMVGDALHKLGKGLSITIHTNDRDVFKIIYDHDHEKPILYPEWSYIAGNRNIQAIKADLNVSEELQTADRLLKLKINSLTKGNDNDQPARRRSYHRLPERHVNFG